jgi:membrane protease YdiL (CAAX protease family)
MRDPDLTPRWHIVVRVLLFVVACALVLAVVAPITATFSGKVREMVTGVTAGAAAFVLTVLFATWDRIGLGSIGAAIKIRSPLRFAFGFVTGLALVAIWSALSAIAGHIRWTRVPGASARDCAIALAAYLALASREELAFRGYPLRRLEQCFGGSAAQVVVAILFALEHRIGGASWAEALVGAGTGSLLFGAAALATRGLAVPIGIHSAWNFGQWTLGLKGTPGIWKAAGVQAHAAVAYRTAMLIYAVVMFSATLAFTWWQRRSFGRT